MRGAVSLVIRRELRERTRQRSFFISTAVTLLIVLAIAILPGLGDDGPTTYDVGVVGDASRPLGEALRAIDLGPGLRLATRALATRGAAEQLVADGTLDAAVDGSTVIVDEDLGFELESLLQLANRDLRTRQALEAAGVADEAAEAITDPPPLRTQALDPPDDEQEDRQALVNFGTFFVFGQIFGYGFAVASSVVEEKSSRVVEVLLAKMKPSQLLAGKIVGVGLLGLGQLVFFLVVGLVAATSSGTVDMPPGVPGAAAVVLGWFVVGFALYAALFAMSGAIASRVEELQNTSAPITFLILGAYVAAIGTTGEPGGSIARVLSFIPFFTPLVMSIRMGAGEAPAVEVAAALAIVVVTIVVVVRVAARVYAGGALRTRGKVKLRDALARTKGQ